MMIENVLDKLDNVRTSGQGYSCRCPAHSDKSPSLYVSQGDDRVLIHCFKGCDIKDICHAIGLEVSDLFIDKKKLKPAKRKEIETKQDTRKKFDRLRNDAFLSMASFRSDAQKVYDFYKLDIPETGVPIVHMLPKIDYWMGILATGTKEEIIELIQEGVISKWVRLSNLQKKKQSSSVELILGST